MEEKLEVIRRAEKASHEAVYSANALYEKGSWMAKPVKTVLDLLPLLEGRKNFRALDLGCGVGRNTIPVAQAFPDGRVDGVDILEMAIEKLHENGARYGVTNTVHGIVSGIDEYGIHANSYDLILGVSALEHMNSVRSMVHKLEQIREGIRPGGIFCLIMNTGIRERNAATGKEQPPQFEINISSQDLKCIFMGIFESWAVLKSTLVHQKYDIPRENGMAELKTDVVTFVVQKKERA